MKILIGKPEFDNWLRYLKRLKMHVQDLENIDFVLNYCEKNKIRRIFACTYEQTLFLIEHRDKLSKYKPFVSHDPESVNCLENKRKFIEMMYSINEHNFVPQTWLDNIPQSFPIIIKPEVGHGGIGSFICRDNNEYNKIILNQDNKYIIQKFELGHNYTVVHMVIICGIIKYYTIYTTTMKKTMFITGRITNHKPLDDLPILIQCLERVFKHINYTGFVCVDCKILDDGNVKIFEINPRFGGSVVCKRNDFMKMVEHAII
jgi:carbamoylphosphate synthase large subunit